MTHYDILEVSPQASKEVIRAAYKSLMQRHHPDKLPADTVPGEFDPANRAALIAQAYAVLSDPAQRASYDARLRHLADLSAPPGSSTTAADRTASAIRGRRQPSGSRRSGPSRLTAWYPAVVIALILGFGGLYLKLSDNRSESPATTMQAAGPAVRQESGAQVEPVLSSGLLLASALTVKLQTGAAQPTAETGRVLLIPALQVRVGSFDASKFLRYLDSKKDVINIQLAEKLAHIQYEELIKAGGELYLKTAILDALGEITGTNRLEKFPPSPFEDPGRYGVIEVMLPESYTLK